MQAQIPARTMAVLGAAFGSYLADSGIGLYPRNMSGSATNSAIHYSTRASGVHTPLIYVPAISQKKSSIDRFVQRNWRGELSESRLLNAREELQQVVDCAFDKQFGRVCMELRRMVGRARSNGAHDEASNMFVRAAVIMLGDRAANDEESAVRALADAASLTDNADKRSMILELAVHLAIKASVDEPHLFENAVVAWAESLGQEDPVGDRVRLFQGYSLYLAAMSEKGAKHLPPPEQSVKPLIMRSAQYYLGKGMKREAAEDYLRYAWMNLLSLNGVWVKDVIGAVPGSLSTGARYLEASDAHDVNVDELMLYLPVVKKAYPEGDLVPVRSINALHKTFDAFVKFAANMADRRSVDQKGHRSGMSELRKARARLKRMAGKKTVTSRDWSTVQYHLNEVVVHWGDVQGYETLVADARSFSQAIDDLAGED